MTVVWLAFALGYGALVLFAVACFIASGRADDARWVVPEVLESHSPHLSTGDSADNATKTVWPKVGQ